MCTVGALVYGLGANEPTCTPLVTSLRAYMCYSHATLFKDGIATYISLCIYLLICSMYCFIEHYILENGLPFTCTI